MVDRLWRLAHRLGFRAARLRRRLRRPAHDPDKAAAELLAKSNSGPRAAGDAGPAAAGDAEVKAEG